MAQVVAAELNGTRESGIPSYATHVAWGLGLVARAAGRHDEARLRLEQSLVLDPNNLRAELELIALDLRRRRFGPAVSRWRKIGERDPIIVPADLLSRVAWTGLRTLGLREAAERVLQSNPQLEERVRRVIMGRLFSGRGKGSDPDDLRVR